MASVKENALKQVMDIAYFRAVSSTGESCIITKENMVKVLTGLIGITGMNMNAINDGVYISYHRKSGDLHLLARPEAWTALQNSGEIANGVAVIQGGRHIIVATTEAASILNWSSTSVLVNGAISDRVLAMNDFDGKTKTAAILANATIGADGEGYAPGFCAAYSRVNANGQGLTAGKWWLPSLGELFMIYSNYHKINYCLSLISGAKTLTPSVGYSTSTESDAIAYYSVRFSDCSLSKANKRSIQTKVRPVSAFIA